LYTLSVSINVGVLVLFKYLYEFQHSFLPPGISFHTFQSIAYLTEVYRGSYRVERNLFNYSAYILYWPQLVAGPIERPQRLLEQLKKMPRPSGLQCQEGLRLILLGFIKKMVIADRLSLFTSTVFGSLTHFNGLTLWAAYQDAVRAASNPF
jgi:D-alanyl-lipoteichoic acid acyltransferase DltB (MBOAT superfamily)